MKSPISTARGAIRVLLAACILNAAVLTTASFGQDPILWINFNDGTTNDLSGNGLDGVLEGGAEIVEDAERGMVLSLNGSTGHVPIADPDGLLDFSNGRSATVAAWINFSSKNHNQVFAQGEWNDGAGLAIKGDTTPADQIWTQGQGGGTAQRSDVGVPENEWHHAAATFAYDPDTDSLQVSFYLNGELTGYAEGGDPLEGGINAPAGGGNTIGREQRGGPDTARWFFDGMIDDVQIYDVALDESGIQRAMAGLSLAVEAPIAAEFGTVRFVSVLDHLTDGAWSGPAAINEGDEVYLGEDATITSLPSALSGNLAFRTNNEVIISDPLNFSFEEPTIGATSGETFTNLWDGGAEEAAFSGWRMHFEAGQPGSPSVGVQNPATGFYGAANPLPDPFDGNQIAFMNLNTEGETIALADSDIIGELAPTETYTLNVAVGGRATNWSDIQYSIGLVAADGTELGDFETVVIQPRAGETGNIVDMTYTLDVATEATAFAGQGFFIRIRAANIGGEFGGFTQANFDNVRLDPEPERELDIQFTAAGPLGFVVDRDTTVYIAYDENMAVPSWISSRYDNTGMTIATEAGNFDVWARDFSARDYVALQGSPRGDMDENNHWVILNRGPDAITSSADHLFTRTAQDSNDWTRGAHHWRLTTAAESQLHDATMIANISNLDPELGFGLATRIRAPRLQDAGNNAFGFILLGDPGNSSAAILAEWLPREAGGDSTLRLVDGSTGSVLAETAWTGLAPTAIDNDAGVGNGAEETVFAVDEPAFPDLARIALDENFEDGGSGWTSGSYNDTAAQWEIGAPTSGPGSAVSGQNVAATNLSGSYAPETASWLRSPVVDLTGVSEATLSFQEYLDVDTFVDAVGDVFHFVTVSVLDPDTMEEEALLAMYSDQITEWQERVIDLTDFAGSEIVLEFALFSDDVMEEEWEGWYLDDIQVVASGARILTMPESLAHDGALNGIATDSGGLDDDSDSFVQFTVADRGAGGNDGVTVYVAWDTRASGLEPNWLRDEFTLTDHIIGLSDGQQHRLWAREYSDGAQVTLGGASAAGGGPFPENMNNYFVLFGDARPGLETYYTLTAEGVFEGGAWSIDFSLSDADGITQTVSASIEESLDGRNQFGLFARHPDAEGAVTHPPVWEINSLSIEFLETLPDPDSDFQAWREEHFAGQLDNPEISGPDASPAGDGVTNLIKYALDLPPLIPVSSADVAIVDLNEQGGLILFYRERTDIDDIEYIPQVSDDMENWESGEPHVVEFLREPGDEPHLVEVGVVGAMVEDAPKGFLRLLVRFRD